MNSVEPMEIASSIPAGLTANPSRLALKRELSPDLRNDHENWWWKCVAQMKSAAASGNFRNLLHLIHFTNTKRYDISKKSASPFVVFAGA